jgi:aspartyl-tRNA(Asn)/glutamyl-tRNA(Gln) amidotransferase subunit A
MAADWQGKTAAGLGRAIAAGDIDPVDLAEAFLEAIAAHPDAGQIYARTTPGRARAEAVAARGRARAGHRRGPLDGVPVSWKDLFDSAGTATEAGSALLAGRIPAVDASVLAEATRAGLVCLGKTHMSELAFSGLGVNPVTATPPNATDPARAPGGSSSGAAASVAFGLAPAAIGSDTGGSVRIPAAWNDLVGFKTTTGRLPLDGVVPLAESYDSVGPIARSVEDCALLFAAMGGGRAADLRGASLRGVRLLELVTLAFDDIRAEPAAAYEDACRRLARAGAQIVRRSIPAAAEAVALAGRLVAPEAYGTWRETIEAAPDLMFAPIRDRFRGGADVGAADHVAARRRLRELRRDWAVATAGFDAVILPTAPILPPDRARLLADTDYYTRENLLALRNTRIGNLLDLSGLSLPTGTPGCGLMLLAAPMADERLLRLGAAAETALATR